LPSLAAPPEPVVTLVLLLLLVTLLLVVLDVEVSVEPPVPVPPPPPQPAAATAPMPNPPKSKPVNDLTFMLPPRGSSGAMGLTPAKPGQIYTRRRAPTTAGLVPVPARAYPSRGTRMPRRLLARLLNPIVWSVPGHGARKLHGFALAEQASMIDLQAAVRSTPSPERRAAYVRHLLDETRHAQMFALRAAELRQKDGAAPFGPLRADTEELYENLGERRFLAFVHRGEQRGCAQFEVYRDWFARRGDDRTRALFEAILKDERQHARYTWELLAAIAGSDAAARADLRRAALWEAWRTWRRAGRFVAERAYFVLTVALYLLLAPFSLITRLARPEVAGWSMPSGELDAPPPAPPPPPG
jgi:hypothetical protein